MQRDEGELKMFESYDDILTVEEACEALKVGYNAMYALRPPEHSRAPADG